MNRPRARRLRPGVTRACREWDWADVTDMVQNPPYDEIWASVSISEERARALAEARWGEGPGLAR